MGPVSGGAGERWASVCGLRRSIPTMGLSAAQQRWVAAGLASLTGDPAGPCLVPPTGIVDRIESLGAGGIEVLSRLGERAGLVGLTRAGRVSCGGATRLLEAADGWIAVTLARGDDVELLPAWLGVGSEGGPGGGASDEVWSAVAAVVAERPTGELIDSGRVLGLAVSGPARSWWESKARRSLDADQDETSVDGLRVVDLSSLWAGPLCSRLLADDGADVIKVESAGRPDGGRAGHRAFFDLLHAGKRSVALDFTDDGDRVRLRSLLASAAVVIEGSRPRALRQLGIVVEELIDGGPQVWISITGHGRDPEHELAVGFGDDAAVAGGLVAWGADGCPRFAADAIADPLAGIAAHRAVLDALASGERGIVDVALSGVARAVSGPDVGAPWVEVDPSDAPRPTASSIRGQASRLGQHTAEVLDELGVS